MKSSKIMQRTAQPNGDNDYVKILKGNFVTVWGCYNQNQITHSVFK